jgi:hypothetical protein
MQPRLTYWLAFMVLARCYFSYLITDFNEITIYTIEKLVVTETFSNISESKESRPSLWRRYASNVPQGCLPLQSST